MLYFRINYHFLLTFNGKGGAHDDLGRFHLLNLFACTYTTEKKQPDDNLWQSSGLPAEIITFGHDFAIRLK